MFETMKLGCKPPKHDPRTLRLAKYLAPAQLPPPPASVAWQDKVAGWSMMANDRCGDCTCAAVGHMQQLWSTADGSPPVVPTDQQVLAEYSAISGYDPRTGANDNGAAILDVLNRWRQVGMMGNRLGAYAQVSLQDHTEVATAIYLFGAIDTGVQLPLAWQGTKDWMAPIRHYLFGWTPWARQWAQGSWGGHCVPIVGYDAQWLYAISWGQVVRVSWAAWDAYFVEAYVCLDDLWTGPDGKAPSGFDVAALQQDLQAIRAA